MSTFICVSTGSQDPLYFNVDHITCFRDGLCDDSYSSEIRFSNGKKMKLHGECARLFKEQFYALKIFATSKPEAPVPKPKPKFPCICAITQADHSDLVDGKIDTSVYKMGPCRFCNDTKEVDYEFPELVTRCVSLRSGLSSGELGEAITECTLQMRKEHPRAYCEIFGKIYSPYDPTAPRFPKGIKWR